MKPVKANVNGTQVLLTMQLPSKRAANMSVANGTAKSAKGDTATTTFWFERTEGEKNLVDTGDNTSGNKSTTNSSKTGTSKSAAQKTAARGLFPFHAGSVAF